jgi:hypothetical protein
MFSFGQLRAVIGERAFPLCVRPFRLAGICLQAACSCNEITEWKRPGQAASSREEPRARARAVRGGSLSRMSCVDSFVW